MPALSFFLGPWAIHGATGHAKIQRAFPIGSILTIEKFGTGTECRMSWTDLDGTLHELRNLQHDGDRLIGKPARDESSDIEWSVTISEAEAGKGLTGAMKQLTSIAGTTRDDGESNLAGVWAAEAPPPIRDDKGPNPAG